MSVSASLNAATASATGRAGDGALVMVADLESLIAARLDTATALTALLSTFDGDPAAFLAPMPADVARGWSAGARAYLEWRVERHTLPERHLEGLVIFDLFVGAGAAVEALEALERALILTLDGSFYHPTVPAGEPVEGLRWERSDDFVQGSEEAPIQGRTVTFGLFAWPAQTTFSPDPIAALNAAASAQFGSALRVDPASWGADDAVPALYWRFVEDTEVSWESWGVLVDATIRGHVQAHGVGARNTWARTVREWLATARTFALSDGSALRVMAPRLQRESDPQREGQVSFSARYGVLGPVAAAERLRHAIGTGAGGAAGASVEADVP